MNQKVALRILEKVGAIVTHGHFVYTNGRHGSVYVNKDAVYPHTAITSSLCLALAKRFVEDKPEAVIAPAIGGVVLTQWTAHHLKRLTGIEVMAIYAEKSANGGFVIKRGYEKLVPHKRILVIEDILTTGGSAKQVVLAGRAIGGLVVGLGALCNRGRVTVRDIADVPRLESLIELDLDTWEPDACSMCQRGVPINTDMGKGREFLERRKVRVLST